MTPGVLWRWFDATFLDLARQLRWSYLPPLLVYLAAGVSGLTAIVGTFFIKEYLGLSAAFLAGLGFWAGIPWALKMPLGHLVDLLWRWKALLVYLGAALIALSIGIMYGLIAHTGWMTEFMAIETWYVTAALLAPTGYVVQDVVADAMTVEAVPSADAEGRPYPEAEIKAMHTTMQTLGRFAIISGLVGGLGAQHLHVRRDRGACRRPRRPRSTPDLSACAGHPVDLGCRRLLGASDLALAGPAHAPQGVDESRIQRLAVPARRRDPAELVDLRRQSGLRGFTLAIGLGEVPFAQEIVFAGSMAIVIFLMQRLILELDAGVRKALVGTAVIIFVFRAVPLPGPGATWFEIDVLGFDQQFLSILSLITSGLALVGMVVLRPLMATRSIAYVVALLTVAAGVLSLPNIGLYYGLHEWTARWTAGVVDARFIAILDTAIESPLAQIAMIPMLAWIAKNAPPHSEGDLLRGHGLLHQPGAFGIQPGHQVPERDLLS